MRLQNIDVVIA